jgi:Kef-type K+ transport system membrane component KefB
VNRSLIKPTLTKLSAIAAIIVLALIARYLARDSGAGELIDALGLPFYRPSSGLLETGAGLGVLLLGAWLLGKIVSQFGLSKITGYLVFGILAGPGVGAWILGEGSTWLITKEQSDNLSLANDLAIALIALTAGGEIRFSFLRQSLKAITLIMTIEFVLVMVGTTALMVSLLHRGGALDDYGGLTTVVLVATVIGIVAATNSPGVIMAMISETRADGPMARIALSVAVCKDLLLIIAFGLALAFATNSILASVDVSEEQLANQIAAQDQVADADEGDEQLEPADQPEVPVETEIPEAIVEAAGSQQTSVLWTLTKQLGGSMLVGILVGVALALYVSKFGAYLPIILVFGSLAVALISKELGLKPLVVGLTAGLAMSNVFHTVAHDFFKQVEELTVPVYALFFALAGAKVNPSLLGDVWVFVVLLVSIRAAGIYIGTTAGAKLSKVEEPAATWMWTAMLPQAGISLALAVVVSEQLSDFPTLAEKIYNILLCSIAINELIGPVLFKVGLVKAGEDRSHEG